MDNPEKIGIDKLSLIFIDDNSVNVAIKAPKIIVDAFIPKLNNNPIIQQPTKHAMEPDKVFLPILIKGYFIPTKAANVSPTAKKNNDTMQKGLGIKMIVNNEPANTQVAPVISPSFSESLIIRCKYFLKNLFNILYLLLKNSIKKQIININDKKINISNLPSMK